MIYSVIALMVAMGILARALIVNATKKEESIAEKRLREAIARDMDDPNFVKVTEKKKFFSRNKKQREPSESLRRLSAWIEGREYFYENEEGRDVIARIEAELILAGAEQRWSPYDAMALTVLFWIVGAAGSTVVYLMGIIPALLYIPAVVISLIYPFWKLRRMQRERKDSIQAEAIIFIMQLRMAMSSGATTIEDALIRIGRQAEIDPYDSILAYEFDRAMNLIRNGGMGFDQALREVTARTQVFSVDSLVEALIQAKYYGGSAIMKTLEEYGESASEIWQQDMRALKARKEPVIIMGTIITLMGGFLLIAGPMLIALLQSMSAIGGS